jgi:hypothetical protein
MQTRREFGGDYQVETFVRDTRPRSPVVVAFAPYYRLGRERPSFGTRWLARHGLDTISVLTSYNCWYQRRTILEAVDYVREVIGDRPAYGYGSSMGAYGLLNWSEALKLRGGLLYAPQFSVNRKHAPFEKRWAVETALVGTEHENIHRLKSDAPFTIALDPFIKADRRHLRAILKRFPRSSVVELPGIGHNIVQGLVLRGELSSFVRHHLIERYELQPK